MTHRIFLRSLHEIQKLNVRIWLLELLFHAIIIVIY